VSVETPSRVTFAAPAKVNLALYVGPPDITGFHPLLTAFQALDVWDELTASPSDTMSIDITAEFDLSAIPLDQHNLVWRAHELLSEHVAPLPPTHFAITKRIPAAGGMAGGSADAAAATIALAQLYELDTDTSHLRDICRALGSDVPFSLVGGSAVGRGRGDVLEPLRIERPISLVIVPSDHTLSTPEVYRRLDEIRANHTVSLTDHLSDEFLQAWRAGDAEALAPLMHNDLEVATLSMMPGLQRTLEDIVTAGALNSLVSGSGPTTVGVARDVGHAEDVAAHLRERGYRAVATETTELGTHRLQ
jgi:4-diphosphocytidyl-2-C-methyl-D-erythritol kinase